MDFRFSFPRQAVPLLAGLCGGLLHTAAFPPFDLPEAAFLFALPFALWAYARPAWKTYAMTASLASFLSWAFLLVWLRHVPAAAGMTAAPLVGMLLVLALAGVVSLFPVAWLLALRWALPRAAGLPVAGNLLALAGLAAAWALLEWVRSWFLFGFPWLTLAASQWQRPVILQPAAWTGSWGISFLLVFVNLATAWHLWKMTRAGTIRSWVRRLCPEFYVAMGLLFACFLLFFRLLPDASSLLPMFRAGWVQPAIPQRAKWEGGEAGRNLQILERQTRFVRELEPDVLLWPESATPLPALGDPNMGPWIEDLVAGLGVPLLMGNLAQEPDGRWYNGIFAVEPEGGLVVPYYAKRKLVPFGEYVPLRRWFPFIGKFVPLEGEFHPGTAPTVVPVTINGVPWRMGSLVCYEDVFPALARSLAREQVDFFFVATNNGWYGQEAAAYQHAAHSVLRAVETRRPFLRCGNDGWSGAIDERGIIHHIVLGPGGDIYIRGGSAFSLQRDRRFLREPSFYVRHGDWFLWVCAALSAGAFALLRHRPATDLVPAPEATAEAETPAGGTGDRLEPPRFHRFRRLRDRR